MERFKQPRCVVGGKSWKFELNDDGFKGQVLNEALKQMPLEGYNIYVIICLMEVRGNTNFDDESCRY